MQGFCCTRGITRRHQPHRQPCSCVQRAVLERAAALPCRLFPLMIHTSVPLHIEDPEPAGRSAARLSDAGPATGRRRWAGVAARSAPRVGNQRHDGPRVRLPRQRTALQLPCTGRAMPGKVRRPCRVTSGILTPPGWPGSRSQATRPGRQPRALAQPGAALPGHPPHRPAPRVAGAAPPRRAAGGAAAPGGLRARMCACLQAELP